MTAEQSDKRCIHCGDSCGKYPVIWEEKAFCCHGCKTVYQLLNDKQLIKYYEIENQPGIRIDNKDFSNKYAYLDNEEIKSKLLEFSDGEYSKVLLYIPSIHCSSCIWLLENLNTLHKGIIQSMVNFVKKEVSITFKDQEISLRQIVELLVSIHYIPQITLEQADSRKAQKNNRKLIAKIGVAGFAFGNIMLLSMPHYVPGKELIEEPFKNFFASISLALSIPLVGYAANDYLISAYKNIRKKMISIDLPIAIGVLALFIQSSVEISSKTGSGYLDSLAGLVFFLLIGKWYQNKTYKALSFERDYKSYFPVAVTRIFEGKEEIKQLEELTKGDRIIIRNQELIPADATLVKGTAYIDYSFVTGESKAVKREVGSPLYAGGKQIGSNIELEITKEVEQSQLTKLWNQENTTDRKATPLVVLIDKVSQYFTISIISIALITALFWLFIDPSNAVKAATAVLIIACPCALALSIPFTFGNMMRLLGKVRFYIKKTDIIERLTKISCIVFDKTGTLTKQGNNNMQFHGSPMNDEEEMAVYSLCKQSTHPLSIAICEHLHFNVSRNVSDFMEIPSSGLKGKIGSLQVKIGSKDFVSPDFSDQSKYAVSRVFVSVNEKLKGYFAIQNDYRDNLQSLIQKLDKHYDLHVISGDNDQEKKNLINFGFDEEKVAFNLSPQNKLDYIRRLNNKGKKVLMIGDGLNDAGALRESYVGISIADDIYQFSPACDAILDARQFHRLPDYLYLARQSLKIVIASFIISFLYNLIGITIAVQAILSPIIAAILMPISSVSVVLFATLATQYIYNKSLPKINTSSQ
jgi:Cu+-exporting ATPase